MAYAALTILLNNMKDLLLYHIHRISDADDQFRQLQKELGSMQSIIDDKSYIQKKSKLFVEWEKQVRELVYELEDTIDFFIAQPDIEKQRNIISRSFSPKRHISLGEKIKFLREEEVKPLIEKGKIATKNLTIANDTSAELEEKGERIKAPRQDNVVGLEDEMEKLIGYLLEKSEEVEIISITGMPGLGKTTLAWRIYRDPRIQSEFPTLIWIYLSQNFNIKDVLLTIVKKFTTEDMSNKSVEELEPSVREHLERGKVLIFVDDVCTVDAWNKIQDLLPNHNKMQSKILITSRSDKVALHAYRKRDPQKLRFLTNHESWKLLQLEVFGELGQFHPELESIGKYIANQCDGLPTAIIVIGKILMDTLSTTGDIERTWRNVSQNLRTYLDDGIGMKNIISWSYSNLPNHLRDSFLYLGGMFPEDYEISAWQLTQLWVAEGFIKKNPRGKSLEETAQDNLKELINNNLVMVDKIKLNGEVKTCRVKDTIREFCKNEAAFEKQNLFQEVQKLREGVFEPSIQVLQKCRRLCVHSSVKEFLKKAKLSQTRSFLSFTKPIDMESKDITAITDAFELLRVFDAKTIKFPKFPGKFTQLVHLRYLTLSGDELKLLPESISKLWNLQTLMVNTLSSTLEINANIWHMMQLRHVKTKASIILSSKDMSGGGGENLQTLSKLSPISCTQDVFEKAKNLNTLGIRGELATLVDFKCLEKLHRLKKLKLVNQKVASENPLSCLPCTFPENLRFLTLSNTYLDWSQMSSTVGNIPNLEMLKLKDNAFGGDSWDSVAGGFHNLEYLYIARSDLMLWRLQDGGDPFPKLKTIVIKYCERLQSVPIDLVRKLDKLEMQRVTPFAVKSAKEVEVERKKIDEQQKTRRGGFKLIISPGDELSLQA